MKHRMMLPHPIESFQMVPKRKKANRPLKPAKPRGPWLATAAICENVLTDKDNVLSLVRLVDRFTVRAETMIGDKPVEIEPQKIPLSFQLVITLKGGKGKHVLKLVPSLPSGDSPPILSKPFEMPKTAGGQHSNMNLHIGVSLMAVPGQNWIDVFLDDALLTRIPFQVAFRKTLEAGSSDTPEKAS